MPLTLRARADTCVGAQMSAEGEDGVRVRDNRDGARQEPLEDDDLRGRYGPTPDRHFGGTSRPVVAARSGIPAREAAPYPSHSLLSHGIRRLGAAAPRGS